MTHARPGFECFFVLAGYFLVHTFRPGPSSYFSVRDFFRRRLWRLAVPYWVALVVIGAGGYALSAALRGRESLIRFSDLWPQVFFVQDLARVPSASYALWFMAPLIQFYLVWGVAFWLVRRRHLHAASPAYHHATLRTMIALTAASFLGSVAVVALGIPCRWELASKAHYLALGCLTSWACAGLVPRGWLISAAVSEVALGCWLGASRPFVAALTAGYLVAIAGRTFTAGRRLSWLSTIGRRSYSIYLTHTCIGHRASNLLEVVVGGAQTALTASAVWIAAVCASVVFGCVFYVLVEGPTSRLARDITYRQ
jgi:peptidoglycan/LPS O-acetylase OafA/YrhL